MEILALIFLALAVFFFYAAQHENDKAIYFARKHADELWKRRELEKKLNEKEIKL